MKVTEVERKESTKHCCGNGCLWRDIECCTIKNAQNGWNFSLTIRHDASKMNLVWFTLTRGVLFPGFVFHFGKRRIMGQGDSARDFDPAESSGNVGILCGFPIFRAARMDQKIRRSPQLTLCGVASEPAFGRGLRLSPHGVLMLICPAGFSRRRFFANNFTWALTHTPGRNFLEGGVLQELWHG